MELWDGYAGGENIKKYSQYLIQDIESKLIIYSGVMLDTSFVIDQDLSPSQVTELTKKGFITKGNKRICKSYFPFIDMYCQQKS